MSHLRLDELPLRHAARVIAIDWSRLREKEARRLRELGFDEGVAIETLHRGPLGLDPIACRVGRMTIALRRAHAAAISVELATAA
jgi:ferrous iron transport protein A